MKGIVFTTLADMVEEQFGLSTWQKILDLAQPASEGVYVGSSTYKDEELMQLVACAAKELAMDIEALVRHYGYYLWGSFEKNYPQFMLEHATLKSFLLSVHSVIHVEVHKLYPGSITPEFQYDEREDNHLIMYYRSPRKLCYLAEGLIKGAAEYYQCDYQLNHLTCMHLGADKCTFELTF